MYVVIGVLLGVIGALLAPVSIPAAYSRYVAVGLLAALDSAIGGINARLRRRFKLDIFMSGFFINALVAGFITILGDKLGLELYIAAIVVFGTRLFQNFAEIRRQVLTSRGKRDRMKE